MTLKLDLYLLVHAKSYYPIHGMMTTALDEHELQYGLQREFAYSLQLIVCGDLSLTWR